ncbi:MAG TPA: VOC family protein [Solirubrobacterales bacterium]|nr:VOC family protein [Solirubrobacterales bacterium]
MNLSLSQRFGIVHDPEQAAAFYRDVLGLAS